MSFRPVYRTGHALSWALSWLLFRPRVVGKENIPKTGGFILASNHISYYDPLLVGGWQPRQLYFFAKAELFRNRLIGAFLRACNAMPVKRGTIDREAIQSAVDVVRRGDGLVVFPEGTRGRQGRFLYPKPGIGVIAHQTEGPIVPAYIHGANKLKACFLLQERLTIIYGPPLLADWIRSFPANKTGHQELAQAVMERIADLRRQTAPDGH